MGHFFEPTPKRLEIRLISGAKNHFLMKGVDLWEKIIRSSGTHIVAQHQDSENLVCLLGESTAWVTPERALLVTCGRTHLARAATAIAEVFDVSSWAYLQFSRVTEFKPEEQISTFDEDALSLRSLVPGECTANQSGSLSYRAFHWASENASPDSFEFYLRATSPSLESAPESLSLWSRNVLAGLPRMAFQEHHFKPSGYSMNAWRDGAYVLIHASPSSPHRFAHVEVSGSLKPSLPMLRRELEGFFKPQEIHFFPVE